MKKILFFKQIIAILLFFGFVFSACKKNHPPVYGSIELQNNANTYSITRFSITDISNGSRGTIDTIELKAGEKRTYSFVLADKTYSATVTNNLGIDYTSSAFRLKANEKVTLSYEITVLMVK
jgi:hypothetical protein